MMFSKNLGNASHFDYKDKSISISLWAETKPGSSHNWYFILPNLSINDLDGVVITLKHGAVISWDGRIYRHCTSVTDGVGESENDNHVYGCMFGVVHEE